MLTEFLCECSSGRHVYTYVTLWSKLLNYSLGFSLRPSWTMINIYDSQTGVAVVKSGTKPGVAKQTHSSVYRVASATKNN